VWVQGTGASNPKPRPNPYFRSTHLHVPPQRRRGIVRPRLSIVLRLINQKTKKNGFCCCIQNDQKCVGHAEAREED
jgi:hypothetical protein